ncbi:TauD/TfdA family dioxygenase [Aquimarina sp. I32.4]|uniref:TauD/TfdA family dioxygenase n=1 Tax=Aquimarina sp. I32.4 TaxID=2053903 RepID=UPI000CDE81EE|nr:TauD/TfdA family dioxygenase [Aquimarina sp. I32.4]
MNIEENFPYIWSNDKSNTKFLPDFLKENYTDIKNKLLMHGAVLFKSFKVDDVDKLEECVSAFPGKPLDYVDGNSPRTKLKGKVYTSTEHPSDTFISLHNELSYSHIWPRHLFFCCQTPALIGGHTVIADSRKILNDLSYTIKTIFQEKGIQYIRNLHGGTGVGPSWQDTFETQNKQDIEAYCQTQNTLFEWTGDDNLKLIQQRSAIIKHPESNENVWFNQADQFHPSTNSPEVYEALMEIYEDDYHSMPQYVCFGDGSNIPIEMLEEIRKVTKENTVSFPWHQGDLMIVDNVLAAHGRTPFEGKRKILVSMSA